jgi:hypothetical protein
MKTLKCMHINLPDDIYFELILKLDDPNDLINFASTNKRLLYNNTLFERILQIKYPNIYKITNIRLINKDQITWFSILIEIMILFKYRRVVVEGVQGGPTNNFKSYGCIINLIICIISIIVMFISMIVMFIIIIIYPPKFVGPPKPKRIKYYLPTTNWDIVWDWCINDDDVEYKLKCVEHHMLLDNKEIILAFLTDNIGVEENRIDI